MDEATLKAQYREKARIKEEAAAEKLKRKEQLEEAAFLYRLKHWNLYAGITCQHNNLLTSIKSQSS